VRIKDLRVAHRGVRPVRRARTPTAQNTERGCGPCPDQECHRRGRDLGWLV